MRSSTPQLRALVLGVAATAGLVLVGLAAGAPRLSDGGKLLDSFPGLGKSIQPIIRRLNKLNGAAKGQSRPVAPKPPPSTLWPNVIELTALGLVVLGLIWFLVIPAVRQIDWASLRLPPELPEEDELAEALFTEEAGEQLSRDLSRIIEALDDEIDARHAVIGCWLQLEEAVARSGAARRAAESSAELTTRVLGAYDVDGQALEGLHALFRAARFSRAAVSDDAVSTARSALEGLRAAIEPVVVPTDDDSADPVSLAGLAP